VPQLLSKIIRHEKHLPEKSVSEKPPFKNICGKDICSKNIFLKIFCPKLSSCDKFYFTFEFKVQMWDWIYQIFKRDQIPICHLSNKLNLITDKPKYFQIRPNINEISKSVKKLRSNYSLILVSNCNCSVNIVFYHIYLQIYCSNVTQ